MSQMRLRHLAILLLLAGCGDPYRNAGTWASEGAVQANLDAEAVDKADTVAGHGVLGSDAVLDAAAVARLHQDKTKALNTQSTTSSTSGQ